MSTVPYFKAGATMTVEATHNGFILHTEEGTYIAQRVDEVMGTIATMLTNHTEYMAAREASQPAELEVEPVVVNEEEAA